MPGGPVRKHVWVITISASSVVLSKKPDIEFDARIRAHQLAIIAADDFAGKALAFECPSRSMFAPARFQLFEPEVQLLDLARDLARTV